MKRLPVVCASLLLAAVAAEAQFAPGRKPLPPRFSGSTTEAPKPPVLFPELSAKNLAGQEISFAKELAGNYSVLFLASSPEQEIFFETWMPIVRKLAERYENFRYYLVAVLPPAAQSAAAAKRWPFIPSTRPVLPEEEHQRVVVPLYADRRTLYEQLELPEDDTLQIVFVNGDREVVWNDQGARTNAKANALEMQIARMASDDR